MREARAAAAPIDESARDLKPLDSARVEAPYPAAPSDWLRVGAVAAASAVLGGLAAAWFYRKTISRLREAANEIPETRITEDGSAEDF
jgi:hypothetical protein